MPPKSSPQRCSPALLDPENPALDVLHFPLLRRKHRKKEFHECAVTISPANPFCNRIGVVRRGKGLLGLSRKAVNPAFHDRFTQAKEGSAAAYLLAEVTILEPLVVSVDGSERAKLNKCRRISVLGTEAKSLNHAFTSLAIEFEADRMSHSGNIFRQGFTYTTAHR